MREQELHILGRILDVSNGQNKRANVLPLAMGIRRQTIYSEDVSIHVGAIFGRDASAEATKWRRLVGRQVTLSSTTEAAVPAIFFSQREGSQIF